MYNETRPYLDRSRRRLVIAQHDHEYGDCDRGEAAPMPPGADGDVDGWIRCNGTEANNPFGSLILGRRDSGYDCGNSSECIQPDGSGYTVPGLDDVGNAVATINAHNFHTTMPSLPDFCPQDVPLEEVIQTPGCELGYILNPYWVNATKPWGMVPSIEWLAASGRMPR